MLSFAPRIPPRLLQALVRLDDRSVPIAETNRRLGAEADRLGLTRPSYQRVRELVHLLRGRDRERVLLRVLLVEVEGRRARGRALSSVRRRTRRRRGWLPALLLVTVCYLAGFARASARPP